MTTAIIRASDAPRVIDAVFVEDKPIKRIGVGGDFSIQTISVTPMQIGFIALGSAVAGFVIGYAISSRG